MRGGYLRWGADVGNSTLHNTPGSCFMSSCNCHSSLLAHTLRTWVCQFRFTPKKNIFTIAGSLNEQWATARRVTPSLGSHLDLNRHWSSILELTVGFIDKQWGGEDCESCLDLEQGCSSKKERQGDWKAKKSICFGQHSLPGSITF